MMKHIFLILNLIRFLVAIDIGELKRIHESSSLKSSPEEVFKCPRSYNASNVDIANLPATLDYRDPSKNRFKKSLVTPVKNCGECASHYAFAALGAMEGSYCKITNKNKYKYNRKAK